MCHPVGVSEGLSAARIKITIKETDNYINHIEAIKAKTKELIMQLSTHKCNFVPPLPNPTVSHNARARYVWANKKNFLLFIKSTKKNYTFATDNILLVSI